MQISIIASFKKQAKDKQEQSTHSGCDPLDSNEGLDLDNSASATNIDNGRVLYRAKYGNYAPLYHAVCKFSYIVRCLQQPT